MKAGHTIDVQIILVQNTSPWTLLNSKTVTLNTSYQMFDLYVDSAPFTTDNDVRFAVRCGNEEADIYVDDVVITDCTKPTGYQSLHTTVTGKGTVNISNTFASTGCLLYCNTQFATEDSLTLTAEAEQGYTFSGQEDHHARIKLEAENIIQSGANVQYKSAGEVLLKPGLHSQSNSQFRAYIIDCGD